MGWGFGCWSCKRSARGCRSAKYASCRCFSGFRRTFGRRALETLSIHIVLVSNGEKRLILCTSFCSQTPLVKIGLITMTFEWVNRTAHASATGPHVLYNRSRNPSLYCGTPTMTDHSDSFPAMASIIADVVREDCRLIGEEHRKRGRIHDPRTRGR